MNLDLILALKVLALALSANGAPVIGKRLFGARWAIPLDGGLTFLDGRPLLGSSKTVRGLVLSLATTTLVATALGYGWQLGVIYSALTMSGDAPRNRSAHVGLQLGAGADGLGHRGARGVVLRR
jgi:CDP-2,3-bis-(O-geranylgeranyl)-sn-glycerol synthase